MGTDRRPVSVWLEIAAQLMAHGDGGLAPAIRYAMDGRRSCPWISAAPAAPYLIAAQWKTQTVARIPALTITFPCLSTLSDSAWHQEASVCSNR